MVPSTDPARNFRVKCPVCYFLKKFDAKNQQKTSSWTHFGQESDERMRMKVNSQDEDI